jgi:hypothetical protein
MKKDEPAKQQPTNPINNLSMDGDQLVDMLDRRVNEAKDFWEKDYKLDHATKENEELYLGKQVSKNDDGTNSDDLQLDNRIFSSIRTIVPYVTTRITEPEVYPSSNSQAAKKFAEDLEKALFIHASNEKVKEKTKFALEDAIIRRRGYLKPRYDAVTRTFCTIEYVPAESIIVDHKAKPYEEPRFFRHVLDKSINDLLVMFPDMKEKIYEAFSCDENSSQAKLDECHKVNEDWALVPDEEEGLDLVVVWQYNKIFLGGMRDPNWRYGQKNFLDKHMMPLVFFNVLNDGRTMIDKTSFVEQSKYLQLNVDQRSRQISENAGLGNIGMPVVDSAALADDQAQYIAFEPDTVLELDVTNANKNSVRDVFDVWKAGALPNFVYEDKLDSRNSIDNAFGTPNVFRGEQSSNNTAAQDVMIRDQAFGRQQEIVDAIDSAMSRLYLFIAQFLLVYGEDDELFKFVGENGEFDYVLLNTQELDTNTMIRVKSGTSMPIDRAQRRATADKAAQQGMIDPLSYWEIMDEGNADKYAKRFMQYTNDPQGFMKDTADEVFNRDAYVDIQLLKMGQEPPFRKDLPKEYFDYLNHFVLGGDLEDPEIDPFTKQAISNFIDAQLARGQKMLGMMETQLPTPEEVTDANMMTDQMNQADQAAQQLVQPQQDNQLTATQPQGV